MVDCAGFAPQCQEVHLLSSLRPFSYGKDGFLRQGHGNYPTHKSASMWGQEPRRSPQRQKYWERPQGGRHCSL